MHFSSSLHHKFRSRKLLCDRNAKITTGCQQSHPQSRPQSPALTKNLSLERGCLASSCKNSDCMMMGCSERMSLGSGLSNVGPCVWGRRRQITRSLLTQTAPESGLLSLHMKRGQSDAMCEHCQCGWLYLTYTIKLLKYLNQPTKWH